MSIRVAIADDHPALLAGMQQLLDGVPDITIVGLAADSAELIEVLTQHVVDVAVTDYSMPQGQYGDGIVLLRFLRRRFPQVRLVLLSSLENAGALRMAMASGVSAVVNKADDPTYLEAAIRAAYAKGSYITPYLRQVIHAAEAGVASDAPRKLSKRESEVLRLLAEGLSLTEIGAQLSRSPKTIGSQKLNAMKKLGLTCDADIFQYAISHGLILASGTSRREADDDRDDP